MLKYINESTNTLEEYGYACGRVRELEKSLLNKDIIHKMIEATDLEKALRVPVENNFSEYSFENTDSHSIDRVLVNVLEKTLYLLSEALPDPYLFHLFRWKYDFHNLKVLLKAKLLGRKEPYPLYNMGNLNLEWLSAAVLEGKYQLVPIKIERFIKEIEAEYLKSKSLQLIEIMLDRNYYEILFNQLEDINHAFLFYYYKAEVDLVNLNIACRCKIRDIGKSKLADILIKYGQLPMQKIIDIYDNPLHSWPNSFQKSDYSTLIEHGIKSWVDQNSLLKLEQLGDNYLLNLLKIGKYTTFGLECIMGYYYAKENDIKNIRIIINGKRHSLPNKTIKKYIRDTYV